jgi:hypothetical protein
VRCSVVVPHRSTRQAIPHPIETANSDARMPASWRAPFAAARIGAGLIIV